MDNKSRVVKLSDLYNEMNYCKQRYIAEGNEQVETPTINDIWVSVNGVEAKLLDTLDVYDALMPIVSRDIKTLLYANKPIDVEPPV